MQSLFSFVCSCCLSIVCACCIHMLLLFIFSFLLLFRCYCCCCLCIFNMLLFFKALVSLMAHFWLKVVTKNVYGLNHSSSEVNLVKLKLTWS